MYLAAALRRRLCVRRPQLITILATLVLVAVATARHAHADHLRFPETALAAQSPLLGLSSDDRAFIEHHPVVRVAVSLTSFPPFQTVGGDVVSGQSIEFLQLLAQSTGLKLKVIAYPNHQAALTAVRDKEADVIPMAEFNTELSEDLLFTVGTSPNPAGLIATASNTTLEQDPTLFGKRIAVTRDAPAERALRQQFPSAVVVPVTNPTFAMGLLRRGLVDYFYGSIASALYVEDSSSSTELSVQQRVHFGSGWNHIAIRGDWPRLKALFDQVIGDKRLPRNSPNLEPTLPRSLAIARRIRLDTKDVELLKQMSSLRIGVTPGHSRLSEVDSSGDHTGIASEFTANLSYQLGLPVDVMRYGNATAAEAALLANEIDLIPLHEVTFERRRHLIFSKPYLEMPWVMIGRPGGDHALGLAGLRGKTIAIHRAHPLQRFLRWRHPEVGLLITSSPEESQRMVQKGRANAMIDSQLNANLLLGGEDASKYMYLGTVDQPMAQYAFSAPRGSTRLVDLVDRALDTLDQDFTESALLRWTAGGDANDGTLSRVLRVIVPVAIILGALLSAALYGNRKLRRENKRRKEAERLLVDMTDRLRTGVFQFRQCENRKLVSEFLNVKVMQMARLAPQDAPFEEVPLLKFIDDADRERVQNNLNHSLKNSVPFNETFRFNFPDGQQGWIQADAQCQLDEDGSLLWSGYLFDLTSERTLQQELNDLLQSRDELMAAASHEFRTPIQNVILALDSIDTSMLAKHEHDNVKAAMIASTDMEDLVSSVQQITSLQHQSTSLESRSFDLRELVTNTCKTFDASAASKNIALVLSLTDNLPDRALGDPGRIKQILYNIIGNAIKYTDTGDVRVHLSRLEPWQERPQIESRHPVYQITVHDTGVGIPQTELHRVFQPFVTLAPASRHSSGLGLALCDRLITVMGGCISARSQPGVGSTFTINLPLEDASAGAESPVKPDAPSNWNVNSNTLVVVDDNSLVRETLKTLLEAQGLKVLPADSADTARSLIEENACIAVITDQQMPGRSGLELAEELQRQCSSTRPVMIMMSGGMSAEASKRASRVFDAVLTKPISPSEIVKTISNVSGVAAFPGQQRPESTT